jgi:hypothetical protein
MRNRSSRKEECKRRAKEEFDKALNEYFVARAKEAGLVAVTDENEKDFDGQDVIYCIAHSCELETLRKWKQLAKEAGLKFKVENPNSLGQ